MTGRCSHAVTRARRRASHISNQARLSKYGAFKICEIRKSRGFRKSRFASHVQSCEVRKSCKPHKRSLVRDLLICEASYVCARERERTSLGPYRNHMQ
jgi:hypothetical protein